ncbi:DNA topoisomerase 2-binding protein 1-A isoform X2 [Neltuma alba]|uniref:DNA topoisomerase 2-binding protein 1-A isoform X2 n=1 Tax=Neltuma alba TaxID=207710 RepID=UPI0010A4634B|nr:DNA topoisomerase 2-binding protein 1-A isoform X2 [Prosopis alba]
MLRTNAFEGADVFMSRNLVPPEVFDALHDALKNNGARVHLCCDPSRNGPHDYHIISHDHEKLEDLKARGCNLLGPQCVLSCAKEQRPLPKQGFTCCLAMDGVKVLASGFDMDEKMKIGELVNSMGGILHTKASLDVNFVIVKNVLAAKYKWALNMLKKPIVTPNWLKQCSIEHRIVPQESYRILPFSGLTICVTRIPADERRKIEMLIVQNGGKYSAELTKKCTHLISDAPEGDKYKVAKRWGHIHIVTKKWFDQSIARRACLNEESYPVQHGPVSSQRMSGDNLTAQHSQERESGKWQSAAASGPADSCMPAVSYAEPVDGDPDATQSENTSAAILDVPIFVNGTDPEARPVQPKKEPNLDSAVARDSESDDNDLYLSECRISLVGFEASEMRKLVNLIHKGGGSRYMSLNDKLTHIVVGTPSEIEKKDVRSLAALGIIYVVKTAWLEDCDREKKEVPVLKRHIAQDLLLPKGSTSFVKGVVTGIMTMNKGKGFSTHQSLQADQAITSMDSRVVMPLSVEKREEKKLEIDVINQSSLKSMDKPTKQMQLPVVNNKMKGQKKMHNDSSQCVKSSTVFWGRTFCFSNSFPEERRDEIIQWISQGKGEVVNGHRKQNAHYTIECHGVTRRLEEISPTTYISSHWIRSCLEGKDRMLLRNLCFVLGATFVEKLTKKVTHLLCKFINGPKYEAACKWGIQAVTSEWIFECVKQNKVVGVDQFLPKEVSVQDHENQEAGVFTVSQFPNPAESIGGDSSAQFSSRSQNLRNIPNQNMASQVDNYEVNAKISSVYCKRARLLEESGLYDTVPSAVASATPIYDMSSTGNNTLIDTSKVSPAVPDVAAAIEDLLEQTSKMDDQTSPGKTVNKRNNFSSDCSVLGENQSNPHTVIGFSEHWLNRSSRNEDNDDASRDGRAAYDNFSETQTESQVVGYEEDLSGRQMLIDRVRTRGSMA